jgi:copper chaperone CopZ
MKKTFILKKLPLLVLVSGLVLTVTFAQSNSGSKNSGDNDTVPKKEKKIRDLDEALFELDKGELELAKALKEIDGEKIEREVRAALKGLDIDMSTMKMDLAKAMKEIDMQKINVEIQKELGDVQKELKGIDGEKLKREIEQSLEKVDFDKIKVELDRIKEIDLSKMKLELENIRPAIEKSMQEAKKEIEKARQEISDYKNLVNALDKDGYLNKNQNYKVEYKNKELTVNGKRLSADVVKKYIEFLEDKEDFTIKKEDDHFNLNK